MICTGCDGRFEFNQGRFVEGERIPGFFGTCYDWYCKDCTPKVPIDATTQTKPAESVGTARDWTEPPERETVPIDAYEDHPF